MYGGKYFDTELDCVNPVFRYTYAVPYSAKLCMELSPYIYTRYSPTGVSKYSRVHSNHVDEGILAHVVRPCVEPSTMAARGDVEHQSRWRSKACSRHCDSGSQN